MDERGVNAASRSSALTKCFFSHILILSFCLQSYFLKMYFTLAGGFTKVQDVLPRKIWHWFFRFHEAASANENATRIPVL
jgi:hypothetical protein